VVLFKTTRLALVACLAGLAPRVALATVSAPASKAKPKAVKIAVEPDADADADTGTLKDPETEIATALTDLDNLASRLDAAKQMAYRQGLGPQTESASRSRRNADPFFARTEWLSSVRELNNYLNQTQVPESKTYLKSQAMLGRSYEELGMKSKAVRAYIRYLAAFLTANDQDHKELLDILRRMIPLAAADRAVGNQLNELLSSVITLDLPSDVRPAVYFFAAKASANAGGVTMARTWLEKAVAGPEGDGLKPRVLYMRALLALSNREYDAAEETLQEAAAADKTGETRDLARLALGRIAVHRKKPELALKYYAMIEAKSDASKDATFESVYVHLNLKQDKDARTKAMSFLARFPDAPEALQLRMLLAYLDMRAGDLEGAGRGIDAANHRLGEIDGWIKQRLSGQGSVDQMRLADLMSLSGGQLAAPPTVQEAYELFGKIGELARRLADIRGEIRDVTYTMGRADLAHLHPQWVNRAAQLATLGNDVLAVGHRLAAAERYLYKKRLDKLDWQRLTASEARRARLLTPAAEAHRRLERWASYAGFLDLTAQTADAYQRLKTAEADLATSRYVANARAMRVKNDDTRAKSIVEMEAKTKRLRETLARTLELLRRQKVQDLLMQSPHRSTQKFLSQYAMALNEESDILRRVRDENDTTAQRLAADDAARAWRHWEDVSQAVFDQLAALDKEIASGLGGMIDELQKEEATHDALAAKLRDMTQGLEGRLGRSLSYIVDQSAGAIGARLARHKKWQADIEWLSYQTQVDEERKLNDRTQLEQQILKDNLTDLQQGALVTWPK
jgi:hypothetical protein